MLSIQKPRVDADKCTINILPCKISHTGSTRVTKRFWSPLVENDGSRTSYFRGRKLRGRIIRLPADYEGVLWKSTDKTLPKPLSKRPIHPYDDESSGGEEDEALEEAKVIEQIATFDDMLVWGHDRLPTENDIFVKGVEEWIRFAGAIHKPDDPEKATNS